MFTKIPEGNVSSLVGTTGTVNHGKRMLGDAGEGLAPNTAATGDLSTTSGVTTLTGAATPFTSADLGRQVLITGAADAGANGMHTITEFVDTSNVRFLSAAADGTDANNGSITWSVVNAGAWFRQNGLWKTFTLYDLDRKTALGGSTDVRVDACMELAVEAVNSAYVELATLSQGTPNFSIEDPWRYVRVRVLDAGGRAIQVGLQVQGQG